MRIPKNHEARLPRLDARRRAKMTRDAHAFVRGSTASFYEWLESRTGRALPSGPKVWICGDAHIGNVGPIARCDEKVEVEIRDLDQTVIGNPAHDLVRLALSLAMSARSSNLPGAVTARLVEQIVTGYLTGLAGRAAKGATDSAAVRFLVREALHRTWSTLHHERLGDKLTLLREVRPLIARRRRMRSANETPAGPGPTPVDAGE